MLFSIVIPVHPPHFNYLPNLVNKLLKIKTDNFNYEIVIAASECSDEQKNKLLEVLPSVYESSINLTIINTVRRCNAAQNRNRVWEHCKGDWIVFTDADDLYHPNRLYIINKLIMLLKEQNKQANLILHNYYFIKERSDKYEIDSLVNSENEDIEEIQENDELYKSTFGCTPEEIHSLNISQILNRDSIKPRFPLTQGCSAVRKDINIRFNENLQTGEDPYFCREVLYKLGGVYSLKNKLMIYNFPRIF
jgi:glycosyltransferase involved in cell wall biosynthesis